MDKNNPAAVTGTEKSTDSEKEKLARTQILNVATRLFAERGFEGTSTREIAKQAGLNVSLISYYFGGKEGLYKQILISFAEDAHRRLTLILKDFDHEKMTRENFLQNMRRIVRGIVQTKIETPHMADLMQREALSRLPYARDIYEAMFQELGERIIGVLKTAQKKHILNKELHPYVLFFTMVNAPDAYLTACRCQAGILRKGYTLPEQVDLYAEQIFKIFVEGHTL
jgi:AcrR family transcriptional regulator